MAQTAPTPADALPTPPSTSSPSTFDALADAFLGAFVTMRSQFNALATNVYNNAVDCYNNAIAAASSASTATTQAGNASTSASAAATSAASALTAPGTSATSTTSLTIGTGSKSLTIQTGKAYSVGQFVIIARTSGPTNYMSGQITSYNSGTGALDVSVTTTGGGGTYTDWTVSIGVTSLLAGQNTWTGGQNFARATVASAATTADIWSAAGNEIDFTGTATMTNFPAAPQAGASRVLHCAGACVFTHNSNIFVPGSANYTASAGDIVTVHAITTTTFRLEITRVDGKGGVKPNGGLVYLGTVTASGAATADIETSIDSTYDAYMIVAQDVVPSTNGRHLQCRMKISGSYASTGYSFQIEYGNSGTSFIYAGSSSAQVDLGYNQPNAATDSKTVSGFIVNVLNPSGTTAMKTCLIKGQYLVSGGTYVGTMDGAFSNTSAGAVTGLRFFFDTGNISGTFRLYGIVKQ